MFNIIARKTLLEYCKKYPEAKTSLLSWYHELEKSEFKSINELRRTFPDVSIIGDNRIIFNIKGNTYRLIVKVNYDYQMIWIRFIGTHAQYDKIDATKI